MNDRAFVDTCILYYLIDTHEQKKHERAVRWFYTVAPKEFFISTQTLREFANVSLKKSSLKTEEIIEFLELFSARFTVMEEEFCDVVTAIILSKNERRNFFDALLAATMKRNSVITILTENIKDFGGLGVKTINPLV